MANSTIKLNPTPDLTEKIPTPSSKPANPVKKAFIPKFDVRETASAYELYGSLPGIEQGELSIEFTDAETLSISGKIERYHDILSNNKTKRWDATVSDVDEYGKEVLKGYGNGTGLHGVAGDDGEENVKYWVEEQEYGDFTRLFTFPVKVDQESVWAEVKNGVLIVLVPKSRARKIKVFVN